MKKDVDGLPGSTVVQPLVPLSTTGGREAIAIIGFALKFPQDVTSEENLWKLLMERRSTRTEVPSNRWNLDGFYKPHGHRPGTVNSRGGHFIADDPARFDAPFFSIQPAEAECMDPQQRFLLETSYHALENAGIPMETAMGSRTSVHVGCLQQEYSQVSQRDTSLPGTYQIVGSSGLSMLANRLSWFYDFTGPSMTVDTACSGSLLAVHLACQDLLSGSVDMALACGSNLSLVPDSTALLSALNMMSPDSTCYSFDERANGYSRSEGFGVVLLKRLSKAIEDGNTIRGLIRSSGCNQDGHTPGITQPSQAAQERLTRETYERAGLDLDVTRYFEAHGTGTVLGDPTEAGAISHAFSTRTADDPIYVGALKGNIGHPEAASGIAGIMKTVLLLEAGIIPPNKYPEKINPVIASGYRNLKFPLIPTPWPTSGVRRASVSSFGYGGTNVHVVMDDVLSHLGTQQLDAKHCTKSPGNDVDFDSSGHVSLETSSYATPPPDSEAPVYKLLVLSAFDDRALQQSISLHEEWLRSRGISTELLTDLAYTLSMKRSSFPWKTFSVCSSDVISSPVWSGPVRIRPRNRLCFVFTGQGAIWHGMGRELLRFEAFRKSISNADQHLKSLGSRWTATEELFETSANHSSIQRTELSQALCTIVQVAMVDLLHAWNIYPSVVVGHSSGEIAAAYASGAISDESAWMIAYFRGLAVSITCDLLKTEGSMVAVQATPPSIAPILERYNATHTGDPVIIACYNSQSNLTLSGSRVALEKLADTLEKGGTTFKTLNVNVAYHTYHMDPVAAIYGKLLRPIESGETCANQPHLVSTITGDLLKDPNTLRSPEYWIQNLTAPVQFSNAVTNICAAGAEHNVDTFVEIGPHSTLRSPIKDVLKTYRRSIESDYVSVLVRNRAADLSALECAGNLFSGGSSVNLSVINGSNGNLVTTLPPYPFNDRTKYWLEGRASTQYRFRKHVHHEFLGTRVDDWNECEARWTNRIILDQSPWLEDHQINGLVIYPAAGFLVMALEAVRQVYGDGGTAHGYKMRDVKFPKAVTLSKERRGTELQLTLRTTQSKLDVSKSGDAWEQFVIFVYETDEWIECCSGFIAVDWVVEDEKHYPANDLKQALVEDISPFSTAMEHCTTRVKSSDIYDAFERAGLVYGPFFQAMQDVHWDGKGQALGKVDVHQWKTLEKGVTDPHLIHPTTLDHLLQLTFPAYSIYAKNASATTVPTGFPAAWFSAAVDIMSLERKALVHAQVMKRGFRNKLFSITAILEGCGTPIFAGDMETSTIGSINSSLEVPKKPLYKIEYKPDADLLQKRKLFLEPDPTSNPDLMHAKNSLCLASMRTTLAQIPDNLSHLPVHLQEYVQWMKIRAGDWQETSPVTLESMCQRLEGADVEARLLVSVARNLPSILAGKTESLNLLFCDDILSDFYSNVHSNQQLLSRAAAEVDTLAHKNSSMRILEIGAGAGSATEHILGALGDRLSEYVYTDVTTSFFSKAREKFASSKLTFKTLDVSQDVDTQGYAEGDFDLIIAANVLHAANGIQNSLIQCRKLLRPGGRILLLEMTNREHLLEPYVFGLLPGRSQEASSESSGNNSPLLTEKEWEDKLRATGFSGIDTCISDAGYTNEDSISMIMISQAVTPRRPTVTNLHVVYDQFSPIQTDVLQFLGDLTGTIGNLVVIPVVWSASLRQDLIGSTCIFLADSNGDLLGRMCQEDLDKLKHVLANAKNLLWVTFGTSIRDENPTRGLVPGLARTLATENEDCRVLSVALDASSLVADAGAHVLKVIDALMQSEGVPEDEYVELDRVLCIPRVIRDDDMSSRIFATNQRVIKPWSELDDPKLTIGTVGRLNTLHFEQANPIDTQISPDELIIEIKAVGLTSRDLLVAQGQMYDESFGSECAGVILQIDALATHNYQVGDRVFGIVRDALAKEARGKSYQMQKIPKDMDFCEAATYPFAFVTAYYSLVQCARIREGESVLIHRGASKVGQASIQLAQLYGCNVFVTVDQSDQVAYLHEIYKIPQSQIVSCREGELSKSIQHLTSGRGVDVVVSALVGEAARESWECLASFGRYIDVVEAASTMNLPTGRNRIFVGVDINELAQSSNFGNVFARVAEMIREKKLLMTKPPKIFKQSEIESAFRLLQSEAYTGSVAVEMVKDEVIQMLEAPNTSTLFDPKATYLLAGGFGGIGQSIARWMLSNGAMNLILPSRTPVKGTGSVREGFIAELRAQGANAYVPVCDIADRSQLDQALQNCSNMPPIKGCIQAAMVLRDSSFANMSIEDWHASLTPKLAGSWNLHQLLPTDLDFFIMFSSSTGIMGSFGQSNYTAGNTYQDALAAHRVRHGQRAHAIAMSMVIGVGWVAENAQVQALLRVRGMIEEVSQDDIYELLRYCCNPKHEGVGSQIITSLSLPADLRALGIVEPLGSTRQLYSFLNTLPSRHAAVKDAVGGQEAKKLPSISLQDATTLAEATEIITEAIQNQLSSLLVVSKDDIDPMKPIHKYGVDSLVAVEMRNWFAKGVGADVGTIEILGQAGIAELAGRVAKKSKFVKEELKS